jgi:hypothetical protein
MKILIPFLLFISLFNLTRLERLVATFVVAYIITTHLKVKKALLISIAISLFLQLLDCSAQTSESYAQTSESYAQTSESFETKPAGELAEDKGNAYSTKKTHDIDTTNYTEADIDAVVKEEDENSHLVKAGGGLDHLKDLLDMAKKESLNKKATDYTPAEAQRATYNLIDTVKQLKETMSEMVPMMKTGTNLMQLYKQMGGTELTSAIKG